MIEVKFSQPSNTFVPIVVTERGIEISDNEQFVNEPSKEDRERIKKYKENGWI